ncbi:hypothetical protein Y1Q_0004141 [Alligator mississippiensis]|uniref:Uncharacterized protein n=1 Tax=Alligator mississippiensis TaxID=8496 RepID=A0A151PJ07_ALLMI|nr:hypothetical protein Y1Q_0004141 [Alligator mississippiensis]
MDTQLAITLPKLAMPASLQQQVQLKLQKEYLFLCIDSPDESRLTSTANNNFRSKNGEKREIAPRKISNN